MTEEKRQLVLSYRKVFSGPDGEKVLNDLKRLARYGQSPNFIDAQGRTDPFAFFRQEGQKVVIRHILKVKDTDFEKPETKAIVDEREDQ